jgi:dihydropteroate synthase
VSDSTAPSVPSASPPPRVDPARPLVMGVVNVTPDSFSDGGQWFEPDAAIEHGLLMLAQGADLIDVGGESTRPGAERPSQDEELRRVIPVVTGLVARGAAVSIDTMRAGVAAAAVQAGARTVNDVSGGLADPDMAAVVADSGVRLVVMHWRGHSKDMQSRAVYADVVQEVCDELASRVESLTGAGVAREQIVLDPGFGFAKRAVHNWSLLRHLDRVVALGLPVLVGTSRKTFLGRVGITDMQTTRPPDQRDAVTAATTVLAAQAGVWGVRVHDVPATMDALGVVTEVSAAP